MARGRNVGAWLLSKEPAAIPAVSSVLPTADRSNHQSETNQSGPSRSDFSGDCLFKRVIFARQQSRNPKKRYRRNARTKPQLAKSSYEFCRRCKCALKTKYGPLESFSPLYSCLNVFKSCKKRGFPTFSSRLFVQSCRCHGVLLIKVIKFRCKLFLVVKNFY